MINKILLADDHVVVRKGLRAILEEEFPATIISEAEDGIQTIDLARSLKPELVILDIGMPGLDGLEAIRHLLQREPELKILVLSVHKNKDFVIRALKNGASGYLLKECAVDELVGAIHAVFKGKRYLSSDLAKMIPRKVLPGPETGVADDLEKLSLREREIFSLLAEGSSNIQIAERLHLSPETVKTHRKKIMKKLEIHNISELFKFVIEHDLTSSSPPPAPDLQK